MNQREDFYFRVGFGLGVLCMFIAGLFLMAYAWRTG